MREKRDLAMRALCSALQRSLDARIRGSVEDLFAPLSEALWWVTVLNDSFWFWNTDGSRYPSARDPDEGGQLLIGLRYARNRLTHDVDVTGMHGLIEAEAALPPPSP